jgi:hypothetical protein
MSVMKLLVLMLCCLAFGTAGAETLVTIEQAVGYSGSGSAWNETGDGFNINIIKWPQRGQSDREGAWLSFGRTAASDQLLVNGWGNVPAGAVSASAEFVAVDLADVRGIPDFSLVCLNLSTGEYLDCPNPVALRVKVEATRTSLTEERGVERREYANADGSTWRVSRTGAWSNIAAVVRGDIAALNVPISNPIWNEGYVHKSYGVTITMQRTP